MRMLCLLPILAAAAFATENPSKILQDIYSSVVQQISQTSNYTCSESLERSFYRNNGFEMAMRGPAAVASPKNELLYDRLRLDVAVSEGSEIYGWHGSGKFGGSDVTDIVRHGPISTGQFIGYLRNIFLAHGVRFTYRGVADEKGTQVYRFDFEVPTEASHYNIQTKTGRAVVPFHGSFSAKVSDLQITNLDVIADNLPLDSPIRSVNTTLAYQLARISGHDALIPASFVMQIDNEEHVFTVSKGDYSQCHEYSADSTLHFDTAEGMQPGATAHEPPARTLPPGLKLNVELTSDIDDKTACTGNPVEAVLADPIQVDGVTIPRGAKLSGLITMFQERFAPQKNYFIKLEFQRLTTANASYTLHGVHEPTGREAEDLYFLFGGYLPNAVADDVRNGVIIFDSRHVKLRRGFKGTWRTISDPQQTASNSSQ